MGVQENLLWGCEIVRLHIAGLATPIPVPLFSREDFEMRDVSKTAKVLGRILVRTMVVDRWRQWLALALLAGLLAAPAVRTLVAQDPGLVDQPVGESQPTEFDETVLSYSDALRELESRFDLQRAACTRLMAERDDAWRRLAYQRVNVEQLLARQANGAAIAAKMQHIGRMMQYDLAGDSRYFDNAESRINPSAPITNKVTRWVVDDLATNRIYNNKRPEALTAKQLAEARAAFQIVQLQGQLDEVTHQIKTINASGNLAMEQYVGILQELQKITNEAVDLSAQSVTLFDQYWELADVEGIRSQTELRFALEALAPASEQNLGAQFAHTVIMIRLGQTDDAKRKLKRLLQIPALRELVSAAEIELLAREGEPRKLLAAYNKVVAKDPQDARVRVHLAVALGAAGEFQRAEREWAAVLKLGGHEVAGRRGMACVRASMPDAGSADKLEAIDHARIALQLAPDDWSCEVALALANTLNGEIDQSLNAAKRAVELSADNNREFCESLVKKLKAGKPVSWRF